MLSGSMEWTHFMAVRHTIIPDRIEAGTYIIIGAAVGEGLSLIM